MAVHYGDINFGAVCLRVHVFFFFFFFFFYCDGRSLYSCFAGTAMHVCGFYIGSSRMFAL